MNQLLKIILIVILFVNLVGCSQHKTDEPSKPNIIIIYTDDLGYGDIGVQGAIGVETPNIDKLAAKGLRFTDSHSSASTCTPSRYSLLTGSYAFRKNAAVLPGDAPLIIDPDKGTLPSMLQKAGYKTAVVGKWHLGLGRGEVNWNKEIKPGPREIGFDYSFLIPATADRVPCVFLENQKVAGLDPTDPIKVDYHHVLEGYPIGTKNPELLIMKADLQHSCSIIDGVSRIGYMKGGKEALWKDENFPIILTNKAKAFIKENKNHPFFLYLAYNDVHVPRVPNPMFIGKSTMGRRGDLIAQDDWCVGQIMNELDSLGITENTLVIFSSDNGPVLNDGYDDKAKELLGSHHPSGPFRGGKYSAFEAGTRMPTIVFWKGVVKPGISEAMMTQVDLYASLAQLLNQEIEPSDAPDSYGLIDAWLGKTTRGRNTMLEEAYTLAIRDGDWKYINPQEKATPDWLKNKDIETGLSNEPQLYNIKNDPGEQENIASKFPGKVKELQQKLSLIKNNEGSR